jgi:hypothetical protein
LHRSRGGLRDLELSCDGGSDQALVVLAEKVDLTEKARLKPIHASALCTDLFNDGPLNIEWWQNHGDISDAALQMRMKSSGDATKQRLATEC